MTPLERFNQKWAADANGCHLWLAAKHDRWGYGAFYIDGQMRPAHRAAWILAHGPILGGLWVLHRCDQPACVNPDHLFTGTHADNMKDMVAKNRAASRTRNGRSKLSDTDVALIRSSADTCRSLASRFGISDTQVSRIRLGQRWTRGGKA